MQALDCSGRKEMGSPAKGERGQQQGFPEKVGLGWGAGGRQFQGYAGAKAAGRGGGAHSSRAVERALWLQSLTWIKLGQAGASEIQVWCFCNNLNPPRVSL